jgi:hypothetical protein
MAATMEKLKAELGSLTERERADLAHYLLVSLHDATVGADSDVEEAWASELARRADEIQHKAVVAKPADQLFAEMRAKYS